MADVLYFISIIATLLMVLALVTYHLAPRFDRSATKPDPVSPPYVVSDQSAREPDVVSPPSVITEEDRGEADTYVPYIEAIEGHLHMALSALPDIQHDLVVMDYGFRVEGFRFRMGANFDDLSRGNNFAEALTEARETFGAKLLEVLRESKAHADAEEVAVRRILGLLK